MSTSFNTQLNSPAFQGNLVLEIDGVFYSQYQVDTGLVVDANKVGVIVDVRISGSTVNLETVSTSISKVSMQLLDKNAIITAGISNSDTSWHQKEVNVYFGYITGTFAFADYQKIATVRIDTISKDENVYTVSGAEPPELIRRPIFQDSSELDVAINDTQTTITVDQVPATVAATGFIVIGDEWMQYSSIVGQDITIAARAARGSEAANHSANAIVYYVVEKTGHALDIFLDVLQNDLGIASALIDTAEITSIKTTSLASDGNLIIRAYAIEDALKWIEEEILRPTNCRIITRNGLISLSILDQIDLTATVAEIDENSIQSQPGYVTKSSSLRNKIIINWDYQEGSNSYARTNEFTDSESIALYGEKSPLTLNFKGVRVANGGSAIVTDRANRLLARFASPKAEITVNTHFSNYSSETGDNIRLSHRYLPASGGGLGFSEILEVASKSVSGLASNARIQFKLVFTSFTGVRIGLIAPAPLLTGSITNQKQFEVPDGSCYQVGYCVRLWDEVAGDYTADSNNTITDVTGNIVTVQNNFVTTLGPTIRLKFCDYDNSSPEQRARYAYIAPNTGTFVSDGSAAYQIVI